MGLGLAFALFACGREFTAVGRGGLASVSLAPVFGTIRLAGNGEVLNVASIVSFTRVRIVLLRANGDTAVDRVVDFPADSASISIALPVVLSATAPVDGETMNAALRFVNSAGDTVFSSAPVPVQARPLGSPPAPPPAIPVTYTGPGSNAASLRVTPDSIVDRNGAQVTLAAVVRDVQGVTLPNTPVAYTSTDTAKVKVGLSSGVVALVGFRGSALVIAQTLTGPRDTVPVRIIPTPTALAVLAGNSQQTRQGDPFPLPIRLRANAGDGLPVPGTIVTFEVTQGGGSLSAARDTADAEGLVEVRWTAGNVAGAGSVIARVDGQPVSVTLTGTQLSSAPTAITFGSQPVTIVAGDTLPSIVVQVRDATGDTAVAFAGQVRLALTGGTSGARLLGVDTLATAVGGVARFRGLTVDRGGAAYRLVASVVGGGTGSPTATSTAFDVTPAPAGLLRVISGEGQAGIAGAVLRDSVVVEATDRFGFPVAGAPVTFAVVGGGTVSPVTVNTSTTGRAATRWTLGTSGAQRVTASVGTVSTTTTSYLPVQLRLLAGGGQSAFFGRAFAAPIEFAVEADSGRALRGIIVRFALSGKGTVSQVVDTSDAAGRVSALWTAGDSAGVATFKAIVEGMPTIAAAASGIQGSPLPTGLVIDATPPTTTAGDTLPTVVVRVLDGLGGVVPTFSGPVSLALGGGNPDALLLGTKVRSAEGGVARFPGLSIDRGAPGYRLFAQLDGHTPTLATNTDTFTVRPAPAVALHLMAAPTTATSGVAFPSAVQVEVRDRFGYRVTGSTAAITVSRANGTGTLYAIPPATLTRNAVGGVTTFDGLAIEGSGPHQLRFALNDTIAVISPTLTVDPGPVGIRLRVGATPTTTIAANTEVAIPIQLNFDNRGALDLASLTVTLTWDPTAFLFVGETAGTWTDDVGGASSVIVNAAETSAGRLTISGFTNEATTVNFLLRTLRLKALGATGIQTVGATVSVAGNAAGGSTTLIARPLTVTVTP